MKSPRILIGSAVYNEAPYLRETIPAILAQSYPDFRLVLLDNGSTDGSADILDEYAEQDSRIALLHEPTNLWGPVVGNRIYRYGLTLWPGVEWILGAGADDVMGVGYLEAILRAADNDPTANLIFSPVTFIGHPEKGVTRYPPYNPATVHTEVQIPGWRAVRRDLWEAVGDEAEGIKIGADWDWAARASAMGVLKPVQLAEPHLAMRVREGARVSLSHQVDWPALHRHLCGVVGAAVPKWAKGRR